MKEVWQRLSPREKKLIVLLAVVACFTFALRVFWLHQLPHFQALRSRVEQKRAELQDYQMLIKRLPELLRSQEQAERELQGLQARFALDLQSGSPLVQLGEKANKVQLLGVYPQDVIAKDDYLILPLKLKVSGPYLSVLEYMQSLENLPSVAEVAYPNISAGEDEGVVQADFILNFYSMKNVQTAQLNGQWHLGRLNIFSPVVQESPSQESEPQPEGIPDQNGRTSKGGDVHVEPEQETQDESRTDQRETTPKGPAIDYKFPVR